MSHTNPAAFLLLCGAIACGDHPRRRLGPVRRRHRDGSERGPLMAQDYHLMVVDTDAGGGGSSSITCINGDCSCSPSPGCCEQICGGLSDSCNGVPCDMLPGDDCDRTLGAGKVFREDGTQCLEAPPRYMTDADAMLGSDFACVAEVGTYGDGNEQPMAAILAGAGSSLAAVGACNEGLVRDDAILVVTFITDEEDVEKSPGDPSSWYDDLVALKGGDPSAIVVLGLMGDTGEPGAVCQPFDDEGVNDGPSLPSVGQRPPEPPFPSALARLAFIADEQLRCSSATQKLWQPTGVLALALHEVRKPLLMSTTPAVPVPVNVQSSAPTSMSAEPQGETKLSPHSQNLPAGTS
ncbi:MAG: hypothetical protein IAG13_06050 [Deltaproteobacteria bacterium]|nr:hypothetical protein [Nannocystaceae bacterium]